METNGLKVEVYARGLAQYLPSLTLLISSTVLAQPISFNARRDFAVGTAPQSVAVGDFNDDGVQDLAAAVQGTNNVSVLLGKGNGTFQAGRSFPDGGSNPRSVVVADFNGDGQQDLAVANQGTNNVSLLLGNGDGSFQTANSLRHRARSVFGCGS